MKKSDFWFDLPEDLIAQTPIEPRDASRVMLMDRETGVTGECVFHDIIDYLNPGDLLVVNNSRVLPARLLGYREGIEYTGLERLEFDCDVFPVDVAGSAKQIVQTIHDIWEKTHFDALIADDPHRFLTAGGNIYRTLGIPQNVKILLDKDDPAAYLRASPQISAFQVDMDWIGYTVAKRLMEPVYQPCQIIFNGIINNRESSGGARISSDAPPDIMEKREACFAMI